VLAVLAVVAAAFWHLRRPPAGERQPPRVVAVTRLAGEEDWPAFSPDGEQIAFSWSSEKSDNTDIYVTMVGATEVRRLTTDTAGDYAASWSPDGRRIAFLRKGGPTARIHVISPVGGSDPKVSDFPVAAKLDPEFTASQINWSPDSRLVAAGRDHRSAPDAPAGIYLIPVNGGEPRAITRPKRPTYDFSPAFSPDGQRLAYVSCNVHCDVRIVDVDGTFAPTSEGRTLTPHSMQSIDGVAWSRDGKSVLFFGEGPDPARIWRVVVEESGGIESIELAGDHAQRPATVASRDRLVFSRYGWDAHLYRFDPALPHERIAASSSYEGDPRFSPDGRHLAFTSGRSGDVAIWGPVLVTCSATGRLPVGPAGRAVFYVPCEPGTKPSLHTLDMVSGQDRILGRLDHFPPESWHVSLAVSPDGRTVLYRGLVLKGGDLMMIEDFR